MLIPEIKSYDAIDNITKKVVKYYYLEKNTNIKINSIYPLWKIALFFVRWWAWGFTVSRWLIKNAFIR